MKKTNKTHAASKHLAAVFHKLEIYTANLPIAEKTVYLRKKGKSGPEMTSPQQWEMKFDEVGKIKTIANVVVVDRINPKAKSLVAYYAFSFDNCVKAKAFAERIKGRKQRPLPIRAKCQHLIIISPEIANIENANYITNASELPFEVKSLFVRICVAKKVVNVNKPIKTSKDGKLVLR